MCTASTPELRWIPVEEKPLPLEEDIIVKHQYGADAVHFFGAVWRFWYTAKEVPADLVASVTHWLKP